MKWRYTGWLFAMACAWATVARAQLQLIAGPEPQCVFAGTPQNISVTLSNSGNQSFDAPVQIRMFQASSATVIPLGIQPWKRLQVLPGQTVLESARLDFPAVNTGTKFLVQWLLDTNHIIGTMLFEVYPTNLFAELKSLVGGGGLGVFDPQNCLKLMLKNSRLDFVDLQNAGLESFAGRLAIIGPFDSRAQMRPGLKEQVKVLARRGVAVVWLFPPPDKCRQPIPSFYAVNGATNAIVVAQASTVSRLPENPLAQLNLIYFCQLALKPQPDGLPDFVCQP